MGENWFEVLNKEADMRLRDDKPKATPPRNLWGVAQEASEGVKQGSRAALEIKSQPKAAQSASLPTR